MKRKYGVDPTKPGSMLKMPDPSLPPEQQMEMLSGGQVGQTAAKLPGAAKADAGPLQKSPSSNFDLAPRYQKDFSVQSLLSRSTADTKFQSSLEGDKSHSMILSPSIRFGLQRSVNRGSKESIGDITGTKNPFFSKSGDKNSATKHSSRMANPAYD